MIHTLSSEAFGGALRPPKVTGLSPLFRGKIRIEGASVRCYVKPMPDMIECPMHLGYVANQEIISEALGYVLAKTSGFSVPATAGIILLEQNQIPDAALEELRKLGRGALQPNYFCWFSQDMDHPNLTQKHLHGMRVPFMEHRRLKRLVKQLIESDEILRIIAFDDWLLNSDRHPGNLLQAIGRLMLIDHGRILRYPNWRPGELGQLGPKQPCVNRLRNLIDQLEPNWTETRPKKSEMIMAYNGFALSFRTQGEHAARAVLGEFFDAVDIEAIIQLLRSRNDPGAYAKALGMVL